MNVNCGICNSDRIDEIEAAGALAVRGERSWRSVCQEFEWSHHAPIKNHMEKHWSPPKTASEQALEGLDALIADALDGLQTQMRLAPPELKAFYAAAIHNLKGLAETKPSQQHLMMALKGIHEVTGMKIEQRLMLDFAQAMFEGRVNAAPKAEALPRGVVVDTEAELTGGP